MFTVPSTFFGSYELHDNVHYNLGILTTLYKSKDYAATRAELNEARLVKPIILIELAIVEALLYDFLETRIQSYVFEGVVNIAHDTLVIIRGKKIDKLQKYIEAIEKHDFFKEADSIFYQRLRELAEARNRIHIQNTKRYKPYKENILFTKRLLRSSERCLEKITKTLSSEYARPESVGVDKYVNDLKLPWNEHYVSR